MVAGSRNMFKVDAASRKEIFNSGHISDDNLLANNSSRSPGSGGYFWSSALGFAVCRSDLGVNWDYWLVDAA